jgi:hypothetical protein
MASYAPAEIALYFQYLKMSKDPKSLKVQMKEALYGTPVIYVTEIISILEKEVEIRESNSALMTLWEWLSLPVIDTSFLVTWYKQYVEIVWQLIRRPMLIYGAFKDLDMAKTILCLVPPIRHTNWRYFFESGRTIGNWNQIRKLVGSSYQTRCWAELLRSLGEDGSLDDTYNALIKLVGAEGITLEEYTTETMFKALKLGPTPVRAAVSGRLESSKTIHPGNPAFIWDMLCALFADNYIRHDPETFKSVLLSASNALGHDLPHFGFPTIEELTKLSKKTEYLNEWRELAVRRRDNASEIYNAANPHRPRFQLRCAFARRENRIYARTMKMLIYFSIALRCLEPVIHAIAPAYYYGYPRSDDANIDEAPFTEIEETVKHYAQ